MNHILTQQVATTQREVRLILNTVEWDCLIRYSSHLFVMIADDGDNTSQWQQQQQRLK